MRDIIIEIGPKCQEIESKSELISLFWGEGFKTEVIFNISQRTKKRMNRHGDMKEHGLLREL